MTITQKENETMKNEDDVVIEATIPTVDITTVDDDGDGITEDAASDSSKTTATTDKQPLRSVTPTVSKIFSLIRTEVPLLVLGLILMVVSEAATLTIPIIVAFAYDALQTYFIDLGTSISSSGSIAATIENEDAAEVTMSEINLWMGTAVGVFILSQLAGYARGIILGVLGERLVARLRRQVYASVLKQEIGFFDEHKTGEIVSRLGSDTQLLQSAVSTFAPESLIGFVKVIISIVLMYSINAKLTSVALSGMVILCLFGIPFGRRLAALSKRYQDVLGDAQTRSTEALGNIRTVQSFASEPKELSRYTEKIGNPDDNNNSDDGGNKNKNNNDKEKEDTTYDVGVKKQITQVGLYAVVFGGAFGFLYCSLWYGFYLVTIEGSLTLGGMTAFQSYVFIIGAAIGSTVNNLAQLFSAVGASGRVFYLLERQPKIKNYENCNDSGNTGSTNKKAIVPTSPMEGNIVFDNVMFSYPTRPDVLVLNAFSLSLEKNTTTALVGSSGSGKSTVVSLIQRFYDTEAGTITLDGIDITNLDLEWLRSQIGYVQQEPQLFGMTIRENLIYGLSEDAADKITQTEIENACRDANAHDFVSSWPLGYDTLVGERGITLSGGQKQRIAIARALLTNCRILLLDEATSALDAESEHEVQKAIENAMIGRTVVVVAHRLSTIQCADQIVVMDNRKIVDIGTHEELLTGCRRYQDLIKRQSTMMRDVSDGTLQKLLPTDFSIDDE